MILTGDNWRKDVPTEVSKIIDEIDGVNRIRDLAKTDGD